MKKEAVQSNQYVEADLRKEHIDVTDTTGTLTGIDKQLGDAPTSSQYNRSSATTTSNTDRY